MTRQLLYVAAPLAPTSSQIVATGLHVEPDDPFAVIDMIKMGAEPPVSHVVTHYGPLLSSEWQ